MYPSVWQILLVLVIFLVFFGHKRVREFGKSLGEGLRDFKKGLEGKTNTQKNQQPPAPAPAENNTSQPESSSPPPTEKTDKLDQSD